MFWRIALCCLQLSGAFAAEASAETVPPPRIAAPDPRPDGVRLTTPSSAPILNQGDTIITTLDVQNVAAGQKIRIQNSNHGANHFTTNFNSAVQAAIATVPDLAYTQVTEQQMEITLAAGTYKLPITQTVTLQSIPAVLTMRRGLQALSFKSTDCS